MKKLFAILLALVMVCSLGVTAFAEDAGETTPQYEDVSSVTIYKEYTLTNAGTTSPAEEFKFTIEPISVTNAAADVTKDNMPIPTISSVSYQNGDAGSSENAKKAITVTLPTNYSSVGIYTYKITETAGTTAGVTYRTEPITLVVTVVQDGTLKRIAAVHTENAGGTKTDTFTDNAYSAGSLAISKTVTGNLGDKSKYFKVTVKLTGEEGKTYAESYSVTGGSYESNPQSISVNATEGTDFYLKDGETITIANLPYGVTYTVEEADYKTSDGYDASYNFSDTNKKIDSASDTVSITNNKSADVDTGISLDSLPYVVVLAVALLGAVVLFTKKRVNE